MSDIFAHIQNADENELKLILAGVEKRLSEQNGTAPVHSSGIPSVTVAEGTKYLTQEELERATTSFSAWCAASKTPVQSRSRNRIWLAFLLIRYGALRLGEMLALDDILDIKPEKLQIIIRGTSPRTVLLPEPVMREITQLLELPMFFTLRGRVLHLDPGYLRRKFYERAKACDLPGALFNPRIIRDSRAIELLHGGVPLQAVQSFLGRQNMNPTANYLDFPEQTASHFVHQYITREVKMKTSARNAFTGKVTRIVHDGLLVEVELTTMAGLQVVSIITNESYTNLDLTEGSIVTATVKAPWVILTQQSAGLKTSARNKFSGTVVEVKSSAIAAEVVVELFEGSRVCALVTEESVKNLALKPGLDILVMFKAFSVILNME